MTKKVETEEKGPPWMSSYADMITILLALFIMLFGMSTAEIKKLKSAAGSLRAAFGGKPGPYIDASDLHPGIPLNIPSQPVRKQKINKMDLYHELEVRVRVQNLQNQIQVSVTDQGIVFHINGITLFDPNQSSLKSGALMALQFVANELVQVPDHPILIDGHADSASADETPNGNWSLAAQRAYAVMKFLIDWGGLPENRFAYESNAEFRPLPGIDNRTAIGQAMNRRVEIILLQTDALNETYYQDTSLKNPRTPLLTPEK